MLQSMKIYVPFGPSLPFARVRCLFLREYITNSLRLFELPVLSRYCCPSRGTQIPEMTVFQYANDLEMGPVVAPPVAPLLAPAGQQTASVMPVKPVEITKGRGWMTMWDWRNFWPFSALRTPAEANTAEPSTASTNTPNEPTPRPSVGERPAPPLQDRVRVTLIPASGNSGSFPIRLVEMRAALEGKPADVEHAIGASTDNGNERQQVGQGGWKRVFGPILRAIGIGALAM
jgi:hypothetical protein